MSARKVAILGTVGVPGNYGGFETLADNLVNHHALKNEANDGMQAKPFDLTVYCSSKAFDAQPKAYHDAKLIYVGLDANGAQSIPYDMVGLVDAVRRGHDRLLLLGVSGAPILPLLRIFTQARIVTNVDGIEWKREKWQGLAKNYLRFAERIAVKFSHVVIADNQAIADYLNENYGCDAEVIPYGGDHALAAESDPTAVAHLPERFALGLCRIEPENNIGMILEAFDGLDMPLVFVGNWDKSEYGRTLKAKYAEHSTIIIHDPVYDPQGLRAVRDRAMLYLHGHSAGGTNPALVEMMHFGIPIVAHECSFNRHTTEDKALYFNTAQELRDVVTALCPERALQVGAEMVDIARRRYTWDAIGRAYFALMED